MSTPKETIVDPLFTPDDRTAMFPIRYHSIYEMLKKQRGCFWQPHEVPLSNDVADWHALHPDEKFFIKMVLAFFASSDIIVNKNLEERFIEELKPLEIRALYHFQESMEDIHSEVYAQLLDTYIEDPTEKKQLFAAVQTIPTIKKKADWANKWIASDLPFSHRLIAMSAVEGIFFSGSFCAIYWIKQQKRGLPGLCISNDFISRDEGLHVESAIEIYNLLVEKASVQAVHEIIAEAVALEIEFITEALPCKLIGMNASLMSEYIRYVANRHVVSLGYPDLYPKVKMPFSFMESMGLDNKSNFFEKRASEYSKADPNNGKPEEDPYGNLDFNKN